MRTKPNIINVLESEGIKLTQKGKYYWALCPFHFEEHESFKVDPHWQSFYCFSCNEKGDAIDFIRKIKNLSFKEALAYLNFDEQQTHKRQPDNKSFNLNTWRWNYMLVLESMLELIERAKKIVCTIHDAESLAIFYNIEPVIRHRYDILQMNDPLAWYDLYTSISSK